MGALALVIACGPMSAANRDGCPDADPGMDYCGLCKSTDKCHYCDSGHCAANDPCSCSATGPANCGTGTHEVNGVCVANGTSSGSSGSSGGTSGGTSGDIGLPCTTSAHPAWQDGECTAWTNCKFCSVRTCARATAQGCCAGEDTPNEFFPCGGGCTVTASCTTAFTKCGCNQ